MTVIGAEIGPALLPDDDRLVGARDDVKTAQRWRATIEVYVEGQVRVYEGELVGPTVTTRPANQRERRLAAEMREVFKRDRERREEAAAIVIATDGGCWPNPGGTGGWAVVFVGDKEAPIYGAEENTTNNRMELTAVLRGLQALPDWSSVIVQSDSQYVVNGMNSWMAAWKANGWRRKQKGKGMVEIKNGDLWQAIDLEVSRHARVTGQWIRGHSGYQPNEEADLLAQEAAAALDDDLGNGDPDSPFWWPEET